MIGVSSGHSINSVSTRVTSFKRLGITFVPLAGGFGASSDFQANINARNFGVRSQSQYVQRNAPYYVKGENVYKALINEPDIKQVLDKWKNLSAAIVGIGQYGRNSTLINSGLLPTSQINELYEKNAVSSIGASFLNKNGGLIDYSFSDHIIGITLEQLHKIPRVIGISYGKDKVKAIMAALLGHWIDVLITDRNTATLLQNYYYGDIQELRENTGNKPI